MGQNETRPYDEGCKYCGRTDGDLRRGLCDAHYQRYLRKRKMLADESEKQAAAFEQRCIESGWIDPPYRKGHAAAVDPFDSLVREVQAEFAADIAAAVARDEKQQAIEDAKKAAEGKSSGQGRRKAN